MSPALTNLGNDDSNLSIQSAQETSREEISCQTTSKASESKKKRGRKGLNLEKTWSSEEIEMLIRLWAERPVLYNSSLPEYMDKTKRQLALREIGIQMALEENIISKKMSSLRTYYANLRSNYLASKRSGSGSMQVRKPSWPFYDSLEFLNDNYVPRRTKSNMPSSNAPDEDNVTAAKCRRKSSAQDVFYENQSKWKVL